MIDICMNEHENQLATVSQFLYQWSLNDDRNKNRGSTKVPVPSPWAVTTTTTYKQLLKSQRQR
jgi:hypothetical protein